MRISTITDLTFATGVDVFEGDIKQSNSVQHRSLMFLFDNEFQHFLRKMLDTAVSTESSDVNEMSISSLDSKPPTELTRHVPILELSALHFFDVLLHYSVDEVTLKDWTDK